MNEELLKLYEAEHIALHAYLLGKLLLVEAKEEHKLYCDVIDAHDAIAKKLTKLKEEPMTLFPRNHDYYFILSDEHGDLARCTCGVQGWDFNGGRDWFSEHLQEVE